MSTTTDLYRCHKCGAVDMPIDDVTYCSFYGNLECPPEYDWRCSECGAGEEHISEMSTVWCRGCGDRPVQHEEDYCEECTAEISEATREAMLDRMLTEGYK